MWSTAQPVGRKQYRIATTVTTLNGHQLWFHTVTERLFLWLMCTVDARYGGLQVSPVACKLSHREVVNRVLLHQAAICMDYTENLEGDRGKNCIRLLMPERGQFTFKMETTTACNYNKNPLQFTHWWLSITYKYKPTNLLSLLLLQQRSEIINLTMSILAHCFRGSNPWLVGPWFGHVVRQQHSMECSTQSQKSNRHNFLVSTYSKWLRTSWRVGLKVLNIENATSLYSWRGSWSSFSLLFQSAENTGMCHYVKLLHKFFTIAIPNQI